MFQKSPDINKTKASFINMAFNYCSAFIQIISSIVLVPLYLQYMTLSDYGAWMTALAIFNILMVIDPGIATISSQRLSKYYAEENEQGFKESFNSPILLSIFFALLILMIGIIAIQYIPNYIKYDNYLRQEELYNGLLIYAFSVALVPISSVLSSVLQALLKTFSDSSLQFIAVLTSPLIIIISLLNGLGFISLALGLLIPNIIRLIGTLVLVIYFWKRLIRLNIFEIRFIKIKPLLSDLKYLYLKRISNATSENIEIAISGIFFATELAGSISIIKRLFNAIQMFSSNVSNSIYTSLTHIFSENNATHIRVTLNKSIYSFHLIHIFGTVIILANISPLISLWLDKELFFSYVFILLVAFNTFAYAKVALFSSILYSSGNFKSVAYVSLIETINRLLLTFSFIYLMELFQRPFYGLPIAGIVTSVVSLYLLFRIVREITDSSIRELIFPSSVYEVFVYLIAIIVGFFHQASQGKLFISMEIIFLSGVLLLMMLFSSQMRVLFKEIGKRIFDKT
jgi:O-antigen/teichoic acid export membrane protein